MTDRPNILVFHCDSMDGRAMGWLGHPAAETPHLDRLAARGTALARTYCNSPQCVPSRASFMSGRHVHEIEAWNNFKGLEPDDTTLLDDAAAGGYRTIEIGRRDHWSGKHSLHARMTTWLRSVALELPEKAGPHTERVAEGPRGLRDWPNVDSAIERLHELAGDTSAPFLMSVGVAMPHPGGGYRATGTHLDAIDRSRITPPPNDPLEHPVMRGMSIAKSTDQPWETERAIDLRHHYLAMIREVDAMFGAVSEALESTGLAERTVVVFLSDHGDMQLEHRQWLKNAMYEASARVPLIAAGPGIAAGHRVETPVSLINLRRTLAALGGYEAGEQAGGTSLADTLAGTDAPTGTVLSQYHSNMQCTGSFMLIEGDWKYIAYPGYPPQLFNFADDPDELHNRAEDEPNRITRMDHALRERVDYPLVDRAAKANDRQCSRAWLSAHAPTEAQALVQGMYTGFTDAHAERIERWLDGA